VHPAGATGITSAFFDDRLLREARELFDRVFNDSSDAFLVSRLDDRRIIEVNDAFVQLTGIPRDVAVSMPDGRLGLRISRPCCGKLATSSARSARSTTGP
jgi:PAS domain-containing protein